ncbi:uncharacterized protein [Panulirus ornatus]|uniref:uncharacterized protein n=1 Tax=Panulirus ornatus TaxID=150431 RepID=UPI003A8425A3
MMEEVLPAHEIYIKEEPQEDLEVESKEENNRSCSTLISDDNSQCVQKRGLHIETDGHEFVVGDDYEGEDTSSDDENEKLDILECPMCSKEYSTAASLRAHLSKKHRIALGPCYTCHLCGAIGQSKATLKRHLIRTHGEQSIIRPELLRKCRHCGEGLTSQAALYNHISLAHEEELHQYHRCPVCPALIRSRPSLLRHFTRSHPGVKPPGQEIEQCSVCNIEFRSRTALRVHLKANHPESLLHKCQMCTATFKYSYLLTRHTKAAHEQRHRPAPKHRYKCADCGREYRVKTRLEKHINHVHAHPETRVFRCTICNVTFQSNNNRVRHYRKVHRDKTRPHCSECTKCFDTVEELNVHRQEHKMNCAVCDKTFLRRDSLREHLLIHNGPKLPCPYCSKSFTQSSNLKRHIRIHTGEKPYKCTFCNKRFGDKSACNSHIRVHTGAERCKCHLCGASFSKRQKLNYHMRKHTGEGLLHCPLCTKPTTNSYALKKHVETHQQALVQVLLSMGIVSHAENCPQLALKALHNLAYTTVQNSEHHRSRKTDHMDIDERERSGFIMVNQNYDLTEKIDMICKNEMNRDSENTEFEYTDVDIKPQKVYGEASQAKDFFSSRSNKEKGRKDSIQYFNKFTERMGPAYEPIVVIDTLNDRTNEQLNKRFKKEEKKKKILIEGITPYITVEVLPRKTKYVDLPESEDEGNNLKDIGIRYGETFQKECTNSCGKISNKRKAEDAERIQSGLEKDMHNKAREDKKVKRQQGNIEDVPVKKQKCNEMSKGDNNLVVSVPSGIHEEPVVVLTRLLQHIMESHCRQSEVATPKPTLGDQLVEQCLQVIMNDDVSNEDLPENGAGDVGLDLRIHRNSNIRNPVRLSDSDTDNVDVDISKSTKSISMSQSPVFTSSRNISFTVDKSLNASFSGSEMTRLCDQKFITSVSSILPVESGTVNSVYKGETHLNDSHSIILTEANTETLVTNPNVNMNEKIISSESPSLLHGRSSGACCRNGSVPDSTQKADLQPQNYFCELDKISCSEKVTLGISKDYLNSKSCIESTDICLDLSRTGMQKKHHQEASDSAMPSHTGVNIADVHKKYPKRGSSRKTSNHLKISSDIERHEVHPKIIPLKLHLIRKMDLSKTGKMERSSFSTDKDCSSSRNQKGKNVITSLRNDEFEERAQEVDSDSCGMHRKDNSIRKSVHEDDVYDNSSDSEGKYEELFCRSGCEVKNNLTSCTKNDCEGQDETVVLPNAQKGIVSQVLQEDDSVSHCQDKKRHLEFNEDYVQKNVNLDECLGNILGDQKKAHSVTVRSDEIAPADLSNQSSPNKDIINLDRKSMPSIKAKEVSHVWRISQAVLSRPIYPFVERSTKCFSSPSVSVSYKSFVPADGGVEERTCK